MSSLVVVLDANVLFPSSLRDTLLRAAAANLYEPRWTDEILEEVRRNLINKRRLTSQQAQRLIHEIRTYFADALVTNYTNLLSLMSNDLKDRHVLAAAVASQAQFIVTNNLRHFPNTALTPFSIQAQAPDDFLTRLFAINSARMLSVLAEQAKDLLNPPKTVPELLDTLAQHAPLFVALVREALARQTPPSAGA